VGKDGKLGVIDKKGQIVIPIRYDNLFYSSLDDTIQAKTGTLITEGPQRGLFIPDNDKDNLYDMNGSIVPPVEDKPIISQSVSKNGKWGFVGENGEIIVPIEYDDIGWQFTDGLLAVAKDNKWGFVDESGELVIPIEFGITRGFSEGFAAVANIGEAIEHSCCCSSWVENVWKWGFINTSGEVVVPFEYDLVCSFNNGVAQVGVGEWRLGDDPSFSGKWGLINTDGELIVPVMCYGERGFQFNEFGMSIVYTDSGQKLINMSGEVLISVESWFMEVGRDGNIVYYWIKEDDGFNIVAIASNGIEIPVKQPSCSPNILKPPNPPKPTYNHYDINRDGVVDMIDLLEILKSMAGMKSLVKFEAGLGDALEILKHMADMPSKVTL
jgi:hypothetical protein